MFKNFNALTNACYFSMLPFTINLFMARFLYASDTCKCFAATAIIIPNKILLSIRTLAKTSPTTNSNCIFFDFISTYIDEFIKFVYWMYLLGIFIIFDAILDCIQKLNYHNNSCKLSKISFFQERSYYLKHLDKWLANVHNTSFPHYNLFHNYHNPCIYNPNKYNHRGCQDL